MSEISIFKDVLTPLLAAGFGTAAGALTVQLFNDEKIEFNLKSKEIKTSNLLLAECLIQINSLFKNLIDYHNANKKYLSQKVVAKNFFRGSSEIEAQVNLEKLFLDAVNPENIAKIAASCTSNIKILSAASNLSIIFTELKRYEDHLHHSLDDIINLVKSKKSEEASKWFFGIEHDKLLDNSIQPLYFNIIGQLRLSILLIDEVISEICIEKSKEIKEYECSNFKKLPKLASINIEKLKKNPLFPKRSDFNFFNYFHSTNQPD